MWNCRASVSRTGAQGTTTPAWLAQPVQMNRQQDGCRCQTSAAAVARSARRSEFGLQPCKRTWCDAVLECSLHYCNIAGPPLTYQNNNCSAHQPTVSI